MPPDGTSLKSAVESGCGLSASDYEERKARCIRDAGYAPGRFRATVAFASAVQDQLADMYLGLRKGVPILSFEAFEYRFGIPLPEVKVGAAILTMTAEPTDSCVVVTRSAHGGELALIEADLYLVPRQLIGSGTGRALVRGRLTTLELRGDAPVTLRADAGAAHVSVLDWWNHWRMLECIYEGAGSIEIRPSEGPPTTFDATPDVHSAMEAATFHRAVELCDQLQQMFRRAGVHPQPEVSWSSIAESAQYLHYLQQLRAGGISKIKLPTRPSVVDHFQGKTSLLVITAQDFGPLQLVSCARATLSRSGKSALVLNDVQLVDLRHLALGKQAFYRFVSEVRSNAGVDHFVTFLANSSSAHGSEDESAAPLDLD